MTHTTPLIYLDYMASTPVDPQVIVAMLPFMASVYANPSSMHSMGQAAKQAIEQARAQVAQTIHAQPAHITFTASATESINLAIKGAAHFYQRSGKHIITLKTEHIATLAACKQLEKEGFSITYLSPSANGIIDPQVIQNAIRPDTILISICHINNEIGVYQDIQAIGAIAQEHGVLFHVDAAQTIGKYTIDVQSTAISMISLSAHKCYGPKGIGALYIRPTPRLHLQPLIQGGSHEKGLRAGTLATHQIVGMGVAFEQAHNAFNSRLHIVRAHFDTLYRGLSTIPGVIFHGDLLQRVPHNLSIGFNNVDGKKLHNALAPYLAVSSGSACSQHEIKVSHVLTALGVPASIARATIRFSLSHHTQETEIQAAIQHVKKVINTLLHN